jgi:hypothetical protein
MDSNHKLLFLVLLVLCFFQVGCSLLTLPLELAGTAVGLAGDAFSIAQGLPIPPPWLFF